MKTTNAIIALGANLPSKYGHPPATLQAAKETLNAAGVKILAESRLYKTAPVPVSDQPWYYNSVIIVETSFSPSELLATLQTVEADFGRVRSARNAPRVIDLDIIAYGKQILDANELTVPHPRLSERAFVLYPLRDIDQNWRHPATGVTVEELIAALPADQVIEVAYE